MMSKRIELAMDGQVIPFMQEMNIELELVRCDRPLCVLLRDASERQYLAHFVGLDGRNERWFVSPVASATVERLLGGQMPLRDALLLAARTAQLIGSLEGRDANTFKFISFVQCSGVQEIDDFIPAHGFRFFEDEFSHYLEQELEPIVQYARTKLAEVIYVRLFGTGMQPSRLPLIQLAEVGSSLQRLITNLSLFRADPGNFGRRGPGRHSVELASQFALTRVAYGSVQLRLESIQQTSLLQDFDAAHTGAEAFSELCSSGDAASICQSLTKYPPRIRTNYLSYATSLQKTHAGVSLQWGNPNQSQAWECSWDAKTVAQVVGEVSRMTVSEENVYEATGLFTDGSMGTRRFKFQDTSTSRTITGHLAPDITLDVISLSLAGDAAVLYNVLIREVVSTTPANTTSYEYTYLDVQES